MIEVTESLAGTEIQKRGPGRPRKETNIVVPVDEPQKKRRPRFELPPLPVIGKKEKIEISVPIDKNSWGQIPQGSEQTLNGLKLYYLYVDLDKWPARQIGDSPNPRSHDSTGCLKTPVAHAILETLTERPESFFAVNRGITVLAEKFEVKNGTATIVIKGENQGICDGATTDSVISKAQILLKQKIEKNQELPENEREEIRDYLKEGKVRVEIIIGATDHDFVGWVVEGRNRSVLVKSFSLADFRGAFDWIKDILEDSDSKYTGRIAYDENAEGYPILNILALLSLFHREWDDEKGEVRAPTIAYASKGKLSERLMNEELLPGYKSLAKLLPDILELHDYAYSNFSKYYDEVHENKATKLGRRKGFQSRAKPTDEKLTLPLTGAKSDYQIENGILFPYLASLRALIRYTREGEAVWRKSPFKFLDENGPRLVKHLIAQLESVGNSPNELGKEKTAYVALHREVLYALHKENEKE